MTSKLTVQQIDAIGAKVAATTHIPSGLGSEESACTVAMINLAIRGKLTDDIPPCMSEVIGKAAIALQDAMPDDMRNSQRYRDLVPRMAGTGRDFEKERLAVLMDWMWGTVLPEGQPLADRLGFGSEWRAMTTKRTAAAAACAARAAEARAAARAAIHATWAAGETQVARVARAAVYATWAAEDASREARTAAWARRTATTQAAGAVSALDRSDDIWIRLDPIGLLERMVDIRPEPKTTETDD